MTHDGSTSPDARRHPSRLSDDEYLRLIEQLAQAVFEAAVDERGATIFEAELQNTALDRAIHDLVVKVRRVHYDGDGCLDG